MFTDDYYLLKRSKKARRVRITVYPDCRVIVTIPWKCDAAVADGFVSSNSNWINSKLAYFYSPHSKNIPNHNPAEFIDLKDKAFKNIKERVDYFNSFYSFSYNRITIKDTKTRWGSCSRKGNLSFNYKIYYLEPKLRDYIVVHELSHLKELNHSKNFWKLIERIFPDYKDLRRELSLKNSIIS